MSLLFLLFCVSYSGYDFLAAEASHPRVNFRNGKEIEED